MSEYIPKYPSKEGDDSNKTSSELLAETLKPNYVPQELMLAWESHLANYSRDTHVLLDQVKDSETALNTQYQALLTRVQKYEQMLQDITMDSNEFTMDTDEVNFTGWNILAQASYWDYLLKKEITKLSDKIKGIGTRGDLVTDITGEILEGLVADNNYISNVIEALSNTPLIQELDAALNSTSTSLSDLQAEYIRLAEKQVADAEALANQQVANAEQLAASLEAAIAEQLDRLAEEAAIRTQLLQELEAKTDAMTAEYASVVDTLHTTVIQELTSLQDGITTSVSELKSADEAIITSLDAYKVSNGENIAALQSSVNVVANAQESTASQVTGLVASFNQLDIGLSKAQADIITSNQARAVGDEALSQQITTINAGLGNANSRIDTVSDSVSTLDSATATKFSQLDTRLGGVDNSIASVRQIANSAVDTNTAQATEISTLNSRMSTTEGDITKKADATALSNLETKVDNADAALSIRIDSLVANLTTPDGTEINANAFNALRAEVTNNSGNIATHTSQITALNSSLNDVNTGLSANANAVANLTTNVTQQGESITSHSQAIQQLQSDLDVAEVGLATKASTTALNTTNTNVSSLDGRVTANTNSLNSLGSRVDTVEGAVSTKLDASVISNYYTKGQADDKSAEIAAGKIESYNANLVIGGANLLLNSDFSEEARSDKWESNGGGYTKVNDPIYGSVMQTVLPSGLVHAWVKLENNVEYTYSALVKPSNDLWSSGNVPLHYWAGKDNQHQHKIHVLSYSPTLIEAGKWTRINIVFKLVADADSFRPFIFGLDGVLQIAWTKLERGNKATDWTPNDQEVQQSINANANAIQTVNAEVSRIDGVVTSQASSLSLLQSSLSDVDTKANTAINNAASAQQTANTAVTANQANATSLTKLESTFESSRDSDSLVADYLMKDTNQWLSFYGYDLSSYFTTVTDGKISNTVFRKPSTIAECWNYSRSSVSNTRKYKLSMWVRCDANASGACYFTVMWANAAYALNPNQYTYEYAGEVPKTNTWTKLEKVWDLTTLDFTQLRFGFAIGHASAGGLWEMQGFKVEAVIAEDDVDDTLATAAALTLTNTEVARVNGEVVSTALMAQNLQASLDNTNANISNNYYTRSSTDQAIASASNQLSSSFDTAISGVGVIKDTRHDNQPPSWYWANYPRRTEKEFKYSSILGVPQTTVDTLGVLETVVPWGDVSGGAIQQRFTWNDGAYALTRYSISNSAWSVWASAINEVKALVNTKLDASVISNYYTKAEADNVVAGKVEQFSTTMAVGGANLWSVVNATHVSEHGSHSVAVIREDEDEVFITINSLSGGASLIRFDSCLVDQNTPFIEGEDVVLSFEVSGSGYHRLGTVYAYVGKIGSATFNANLVLDPTKWQRIVHKFKATGVALNGPNQLLAFNLQLADGWNVGTSLNLRHVQLQRGNTATAFSKSPAIARATIKETTQTINGIQAIKTVTIDNNGVMSGYGLISQLKNGQVTSAFGVNADTFYIGAPASNKKPFLVTTVPQNIDGITYPAGTWINSAIIANATIGSAHIADASITNAKISSLDATKITTGTLDAARIKVGAATQYEIGYDPITKARTFIAQPITPYRVGDIWKNGNTTSICIFTRLTGSYVAADWGKSGDVTSENTAANSDALGGQSAATVNGNISTATNNASNALTAANSANTQVNNWKFTGTTEIDGGKIRADTVTAVQIDVAELSAISATIGTLRTKTSGSRLEIRDDIIEVFDANGVVRVQLGIF